MPAEYGRPASPIAAEYSGGSPRRLAKRLFHATRPKFFPASVLPVIVGTAWGVLAVGQMDSTVFFLALLATVCVHAGSNVLNDVGDEALGTDRVNENRIYPYTGGSQFIQTGILDSAGMARLGAGLLAVAIACGVALLIIKGALILVFGLLGIALGVLYSLGPVRLSSLGLGEAAVAVAFGVLPITGAAWLQGAAITADLLLFSVPVSAWVAAILLINEVPDIDADGATGKRTLPVRLGLSAVAWLYLMLQLAAFVVISVLTVNAVLPLLAPVVPLGLLWLAWPASQAIRNGVAQRDAMTSAIETTLTIHTLGALWLTACVLFAYWWPGA